MESKVLEMLKQDKIVFKASEKILLKPLNSLTREERRKYFQEIEPELKALRTDLQNLFKANPAMREKYLNAVVSEVLDNKGVINTLNSTVIKALGSFDFYRLLIAKAREKNIKLSLQTNNYTFLVWLLLFFVLFFYILITRRS
ncbi:hypothetical protein [Carboxydothermus hydrogenoformans]|uniref:Conserved domain protein n=1 Tax=Carboxydothermus hydrogenoformans (strain ATCC BAA-161 / DSM 6008 / Z-2901) TaxID=246194 RepID=Q3ACQ5_CARHZ|nr:hypothetical protein [Carboxydothermus hydrogenoformans]ABB14172.1 conserved domain protein [Carboxydothermus hydrogenoformans Z-2901]